eukprot:13074187-Alexandrium_andersonii.AAC.1
MLPPTSDILSSRLAAASGPPRQCPQPEGRRCKGRGGFGVGWGVPLQARRVCLSYAASQMRP